MMGYLPAPLGDLCLTSYRVVSSYQQNQFPAMKTELRKLIICSFRIDLAAAGVFMVYALRSYTLVGPLALVGVGVISLPSAYVLFGGTTTFLGFASVALAIFKRSIPLSQRIAGVTLGPVFVIFGSIFMSAYSSPGVEEIGFLEKPMARFADWLSDRIVNGGREQR